jgi:hypothetical protein
MNLHNKWRQEITWLGEQLQASLEEGCSLEWVSHTDVYQTLSYCAPDGFIIVAMVTVHG